MADRIVVGCISSFHGLEGAVRTRSLTDMPGRFKPGMYVIVGDLPLRIEKVSGTNENPILSFEGINNRENAASLIGRDVCIPSGHAAKPAEDEFFHYELVGMEVFNPAGKSAGKVVSVERYPSCDAIALEDGSEIPLVRDFIEKIDRENFRITLKNGALDFHED